VLRGTWEELSKSINHGKHRADEPQPKEFSHEGAKSTKNTIKTRKLLVDCLFCNVFKTRVL